MRALALAFLLLSPAAMTLADVSPTAEPIIPPSDARILSLGRVDKQAQAWRFDWSAVSVCFRFQGPDFALLLDDGGADFNVWVDGALRTIWRTRKGEERYEVNGLDAKEHRVQVQRRNEPSFGVTTFKGIILPRGGVMLEPGEGWHKQRRLEFDGASWTCGYGNEGPGLHCTDLRPVENAGLAFPQVTADLLDAEYLSVAYSGRGLVRNYGEPGQRSAEPYGAFYGRTVHGDPKTVWDAKQWTPDAVVINLGGNDYSTEPHPKTEDFIQAQEDLLIRLRKQYPKAYLVCFISGGWPFYKPHIDAAVAKRVKAGDKNVGVLVYEDFKPEELACDYHPKAWGHRRLGEQLAAHLKGKLGW